ncbi:MAG: homoserine O-acetyltransferase [Acidobacteriia bacterium]|nr:homoserine O-acetyltransferase [Terriglobia bacterium]
MAALQPTFEGDVTLREQPFVLDCGAQLPSVTLHYAVYGDPARLPVVLVCHALSGSARAAEWWPQLYAPRAPLDRFASVCFNIVGSCYGSTGPTSVDPATDRAYGPEFPPVTIADIVRAQASALETLGIHKLYAVIGASIGGMQALQWAIDFPERVERCIAIGAAPLSAMGLAFNHLQRQAIRLDPGWEDGRYARQPASGLGLARAIAMCTYKSATLFDERHARRPNPHEDPYRSLDARFDVAGYLDHQGAKMVARFDANSYLVISKAMDTFDPVRGYTSDQAAFGRIRARTTLVGISTDWLFPATDVWSLSQRIRGAGATCDYAEIDSGHGHDGFLADAHLLEPILLKALDVQPRGAVAAHTLTKELRNGTGD